MRGRKLKPVPGFYLVTPGWRISIPIRPHRWPPPSLSGSARHSSALANLNANEGGMGKSIVCITGSVFFSELWAQPLFRHGFQRIGAFREERPDRVASAVAVTQLDHQQDHDQPADETDCGGPGEALAQPAIGDLPRVRPGEGLRLPLRSRIGPMAPPPLIVPLSCDPMPSTKSGRHGPDGIPHAIRVPLALRTGCRRLARQCGDAEVKTGSPSRSCERLSGKSLATSAC